MTRRHLFDSLRDNPIEPDICDWGDCEHPPVDGLRICLNHALRAVEWIRTNTVPDERIDRALQTRPNTAPAAFTLGWVYAMSFGDLVKIGFAQNVARRAKAIPNDGVIGVVRGTMSDEKSAHATLRAHRYQGEWFHKSPEVMAWISENMQRYRAA